MSGKGDFESKLKKLEDIVVKLEAGELDIEEVINMYQEGTKLGADCRKILEGIETRVNKIIESDGDGEPIAEPIDE